MTQGLKEAEALQVEILARSSSPVWLKTGIIAVIDAIKAPSDTSTSGTPQIGDIGYTGVGLDCVTFVPSEVPVNSEELWFTPPWIARAVEVNWSAGDLWIETYDGNLRKLPRRQPMWRMNVAVRRIRIEGTTCGEVTLYR